jgi:hypothetical protein
MMEYIRGCVSHLSSIYCRSVDGNVMKVLLTEILNSLRT